MKNQRKKKALHKDFFVEIKKSFNRFISIFFIVALGVAFYSGIQASSPDMRRTGDRYFDVNHLMDLKVMGTLGLTDSDMEALKQIEGVQKVEPGYMVDVLCGDEESQTALHIESLPREINHITIEEGIMAENPGECIMDYEYAQGHNYKVGDTITVNEQLEEDEDPILKSHEYKITGLGSSPMYISFQRGNTSLGTGELDGFLYVLPEEFDQEVYTQAYLLVQGAADVEAYTDQYDAAIKAVQDRVEAIEGLRCEARYNEVMDEANEKLDEAKTELEDGKKEAESELAKARKEIKKGRKKLKKAKKQIEEGKQQLEEAKVTLGDKESELADAKIQLNNGWAQLNTAKEQLSQKEKEYNTQAAAGRKQIEEGEKALAKGKKEYEAGKKEYESGYAQYNSGLKEYQANKAAYDEQLAQYEEGISQYESAESQYSQGVVEYENNKAAYEAALAAGAPGDSEKMVQTKAQLDAAKTVLDATRVTLDQTKAQLDSGKPALDAAKAPLIQAKATLDATKSQLDKAKATLDASEKKIKSSEAELAAAKKKLEEGASAIANAKSQIAGNEATLNSTQAQIADGEAQIASAKGELEEKEKELADGEKEIAENQQKIKDAKKEYKKGKKEAEEEIADGEEKIREAEEEIAKIKKPEWYVTNRSSLVEYDGYGENAERMKNIGEVFPVLFFLVAALISLTTMTRMVEEQRTQIGTLKALGYSKLSIASKYINYALLATLGGSIFGVIIGEKILPYIIINAYGIMYHHMGSPYVPYNLQFGLLATGAAVICTMAATISACYRELAATPASLMRPPVPKKGKRVLMERIPFLWNRMSFIWKSTWRNLFRYKRRFLMTIFGIGGCMALLLVGYGLQDSIMNIAALQYGEIQKYDTMVILEEDITDEQIENLDETLKEEADVELYQMTYMKKTEVSTSQGMVETYLMVPDDARVFEELLHMRDRITGETYGLEDQGMVLTEKTAKMLDAEVGDTVNVSREDGKDVQVEITAICENYMSHYAYLSPRAYEKAFGSRAQSNSYLVKMKEGATDREINQTGQQLLQREGTLSINYTGNIQEQLNNMLGSLDMVMIVLILSAGLLAFVVLYNLNNININERKRELATLKVLGFYDGEVGAYVYRENVMLTLMGAGLGVILGIILHRFVIETVEVDVCMFGRNIDLSSFVISILLTIAFSVFVNFVMYYKLKKIDMVESLKSVE